MPIFEYACEACGHQFEKLTLSKADPSAADPEPACEGCGRGPVRRLLSSFSARSGTGSPSRAGSGSRGEGGGGGCGRPGGCGCH